MPTYRFGDWRVEPDRNRIASGDLVRQLEPRSMDILVHLLEHPYETVSTESLLDTVWAERVVEPNAVHRCIAQIRQALGDDSQHPKYIETIRKRGYRAVGVIEKVTSNSSSNDGAPTEQHADSVGAKQFGRWTTVGIALLLLIIVSGTLLLPGAHDPEQAPPERVAILSLRNLSPRADLDYLASGLTLELTNRLRASLADTDSYVVLPEPVVRGKAVAQAGELADIVAYGALRVDGNDAVVSLEVLRLADDKPFWTNQVRGPLADPYRLQEQVAGHLARVFKVALQNYDAPSDPQAYSAYLKFVEAAPAFGQHGEAMYWLGVALDREPGWADGWADMLGYKITEFFYFGDPADLAEAEHALERMRELESYRVSWGQAIIAAYGRADWENAEPVFRQMADGWPYFYAQLLLVAGLYREAERAAVQALAAKPYPTPQQLWEVVALARANLGDFQGAAVAFKEIVLLLRPGASVNTRAVLALLEGRDADIDAVLEEMETAVERTTPDSVMFRKLSMELRLWQVWWEQSHQRTELARRSANYFVERDQPYIAAPLFVMLGDEESAAAQLERAREQLPHRQLGWYYTTMLLSAEQRSHPVIRGLEQLMGLTPQWRLELCRRVSTLPPSTGFACNPDDYADLESVPGLAVRSSLR